MFGDITERITKLAGQVEELLVEVNAHSEYVIAGLVNHETIPLLSYDENVTMDEERENKFYNVMTASTISRCSGCAWLRASGCDGYLQYFIKCGRGIDTEEFDRDKLMAYFSFMGVELRLNTVESSKTRH